MAPLADAHCAMISGLFRAFVGSRLKFFGAFFRAMLALFPVGFAGGREDEREDVIGDGFEGTEL